MIYRLIYKKINRLRMDKKSTEEEEVIFDSQAPLSNQDKVEENKELEEKPKPLNATWKAHKLEIQKGIYSNIFLI